MYYWSNSNNLITLEKVLTVFIIVFIKKKKHSSSYNFYNLKNKELKRPLL